MTRYHWGVQDAVIEFPDCDAVVAVIGLSKPNLVAVKETQTGNYVDMGWPEVDVVFDRADCRLVARNRKDTETRWVAYHHGIVGVRSFRTEAECRSFYSGAGDSVQYITIEVKK